MKYDFGGWATKNDLLCSDGRVIKRDAFKHYDGREVPLVWNHLHNDPSNILGYASLENRKEGVYAYCSFNNTNQGQVSKELVRHGDIVALSIFANKLKQKGSDVLHGEIREVSLVLAPANPGASIDSVMIHGEDSEESGIIYTGEYITINHSAFDNDEELEDETDEEELEDEEYKENEEEITHSDDETIADIFETLDEKQKTAIYAIMGQLVEDCKKEDKEDKDDDTEGGTQEMKHNIFDKEENKEENTLSHDAVQTIISDAKRYGSMKESFLAHAETYGIDNIEFLFPEARTLTNQPQFIQRDMGWVQKVIRGVHKTPFSRIKSVFANITEDDARAKGYLKGKLKKEEVFSLLKRTTTPTTIYKKQKMDRDDVVDITDFDVITWLKAEMRMMLDEEIARAILIGDGRLASSDDKINEQNIRPIIKDEELYTIQAKVNVTSGATWDVKAKEFIRTVIKSRKDYKGSGSPTLYTTEDMVTDCLLLEDKMGRIIYDSVEKLATALRVKEIVTVPVMEGVQGKNSKPLMGVLVNLVDYNVGADKGGAINMFDDFDIDYNQQKYLIETRCSGALVKPYSAIAFELHEA